MDDLEFHERMRNEILAWLDDVEEGVTKTIDQQQKITQEVFSWSKTYWLTTLNMISGFQEQNERVWNTLMNEGVIAQNESKAMIQEWMNSAKLASAQFKKTMEDNGPAPLRCGGLVVPAEGRGKNLEKAFSTKI